jgi:hypothetical protein
MGLYQKFCEWGTDAKFVPHGKKCDLCGKKLPYLDTGFWSVNAKRLADGVICGQCLRKLNLLADYRNSWIPKTLRKTDPFRAIYSRTPHLLKVQEAQTVFEAAQTFAKEYLSSVGPDYSSCFHMRNACFIEPTALQVGIKRAKQLNSKLVLFGFVQLGRFQKGDKVLICDKDGSRQATVLEAYVYDPDVPENDLEVMLKAHMGKQQLSQWQTGWLVLDDEETVTDHTTVVG